MKKEHFFCIYLYIIFNISAFSQSAGDIAFIGFNTDGNKDFAIVTLADIAASSTIYFTDDETTGIGSPSALAGSEGTITWSTGSNIIKAGTVVVFTDLDSDANANFGSSIGTIIRTGSFNIATTKDGIIAFVGTDANTPTTYIAALQIGNDNTFLGPFDGDGITLTNTGLVIGTSIIVADNSASPDGGYYSGSRSSETSYSDYYTQIETNGNWITSISDGEQYLPYSQESFTINTTNWTGASSNVWNLDGNWDNGIPTSSSLATIPNVATSPIISSGTTANVGNLVIDASEILTINAGNSLTASGNITINGDLSINGSGSLILNGTSTGNITYNVTISDTNWHLISSPVEGEQFDDTWVTNNNIVASTTPGLESNRAIGTYDNTTDADGSWTYFQSGGGATTFATGTGYSLKRTASGNYSFIGTLPTSDVTLNITQGFGGVNKWNLVGNPYTSYIKVSDLITANAANLTDTHEFIYVWNGSAYTTLNGTDYIHPGQGFFVNADNSNAGNFVITESLQSHQTGVTFYKTTTTQPTIELFVKNNENKTVSTKIKYLDTSTKGLDPGFDAGTFTGETTNFNIYSHLVENDEGVDFMLQSLPKDYENIIIPIGLTANPDNEITFSVNYSNLPASLMVFLEDKKENTIVRLDEDNSIYKVTLNSDDTSGRFYLRTSVNDLSKTLSNELFNLENINIYMSSNRILKVNGIQENSAKLKIYNTLGSQVYKETLKGSLSFDVQIPSSIKSGVYIINLETEKGSSNKKIFLE